MSTADKADWAYAGFIQSDIDNSRQPGKFIYYELNMFGQLDVIPTPVLMVGIPRHGTAELKAYWGNIQAEIAKDYGVTQQTVSRWIDNFKLEAAMEQNRG